MKRALVVIVLASIMIPVSVLAANNSSSTQGQTNGNSPSANSTNLKSTSPSSDSNNLDIQSTNNQSQNQTSVQNQGNTTQIQNQNVNPSAEAQDQIKTRLEKDLKTIKSQYSPRSATAEQRMSTVAKSVQSLLQSSYRLENENKGLGEQVRIIAQEQVQTHDKINQSLDKAEKRSGFAKFFIGPNYTELLNARQQMEQNKLKIQELNQIAAQISNPVDQAELKVQIKTLEEQNINLNEQLQKNASGFSLFGWLNKWINKY